MASNVALDITLGIESQDRAIGLSINRAIPRMELSIEKSTHPTEEYDGPYSVEPQLYYGQILATGGKLMVADVSVGAIPIYETSNPTGGKTVTIGSL